MLVFIRHPYFSRIFEFPLKVLFPFEYLLRKKVKKIAYWNASGQKGVQGCWIKSLRGTEE